MGKLRLHPKKSLSRHLTRFELNQNIDVAIRPEIPSQHGLKERELANTVASAEICDFILRNNEVLIHIFRLSP